ncbi:hypothetical protein RvY_10198-1 [Ramazzottius varieornatus]|uniref:E3 ubiquitin-protein ligase n=1 Tax=Ramazzottius varieornatus TaxID=947166 RepID=A0A1D1VC02_RAMVA|nr:hypothetical protein RvY_10198-1 [Ramazzottius varieornatus]
MSAPDYTDESDDEGSAVVTDDTPVSSRSSASASPSKISSSSLANVDCRDVKALTDSQSSVDCCVCAETALHPVKLPCSHIFCFLCIKGCFVLDGNCPLCRAKIDPKAIESPTLVGPDGKSLKQQKRRFDHPSPSSKKTKPSKKAPPTIPTVTVIHLHDDDDESSALQGPLGWFYEGRGGGWWQYDERTSAAIDDAVSKGQSSLEVMLAGHIYILDFVALVQMQKDNPAIRRRMMHGVADASTKGIAGLTKQKLACG